ncbi:MAG: hypothetical protein CUN55_20120 [Phototrophicales bacterium]|nr:MAG: hypothetical protein CUN55_20120 [Phototrophicales bacterium]
MTIENVKQRQHDDQANSQRLWKMGISCVERAERIDNEQNENAANRSKQLAGHTKAIFRLVRNAND